MSMGLWLSQFDERKEKRFWILGRVFYMGLWLSLFNEISKIQNQTKKIWFGFSKKKTHVFSKKKKIEMLVQVTVDVAVLFIYLFI